MKYNPKTLLTLAGVVSIGFVFAFLPSLSTVKTAQAFTCGEIRLPSGFILFIPCEVPIQPPIHGPGDCPACTITISPKGLDPHEAIKVQSTTEGEMLISVVPSNMSMPDVPMNTMSKAPAINSTTMGQ